jgi:hypothetical protein
MRYVRTTGSAVIGALALAVLLVAANAGTSQAASPIFEYYAKPTTTQAGGHPDLAVRFRVGNTLNQGVPDPCYCSDAKTVEVHLPTGVIGNPHAAPTCTDVEFASHECPGDSQVGVVVLVVGYPAFIQTYVQPIFNFEPKPGQAGLLGFAQPLGNPVSVVLSARTGGDYGLDATVSGIERLIPVEAVTQVLWGVPADPVHDALRFPIGVFGFNCLTTEPTQYIIENLFPTICENGPPFPLRSSNSGSTPFLSNPTRCSGPLTTSIDTLSYDHGTDHAERPYPAITGCDQLTFNPSLSAQPTSAEADAPSGLDVDLKVPQFQSPTTPSPSQIRESTITLPPGFSINSNAGDGKTSCSDEEARIGTEDAAQCPEFAKIGTVSLDSSALPGPIPGFIYLGEPRPGDRYRLILTADGFATHVKLTGSIAPDPVSGQLVTTFANLPQSPLQEFKLHFFGSERGALATPTQCGKYAVHSTFVPWDEALAEQKATQFFSIDTGPGGSPCPNGPRPFRPTFAAAALGNTAGEHSPFWITLGRNDGDQNLDGLTVQTPPGLAAKLKGIPYCSESALARLGDSGYSGALEAMSPSCPPASQIGTAIAGAGAGTHPLHLPGKVYLAGPYKGAPLSLVAAIPATSGPYDLGTVAVRAAIALNPTTAQVTATSDPLPQILGGIPFRTRFIRVNLDRPDFAINPTNCDPKSVLATVSGTEGASAQLSSSFQVANCATLPYAPTLALRLSGGLNRRGHPAIRAIFKAKPGEANSKKISVTLPKGELLDNAHIRNICTRVDFAREACPDSSVLGTVEATTPLLDQPLKGNVYLRSSSHKLPDLAVDLEGQIDIELVGRIDSVKGRLRTTFEDVPDAPVSSVVLNLMGGKKGLINNSEDLCGASKAAMITMTGQNGTVLKTKSKLQATCDAESRRKRKQRHRQHVRKAVG